MVGSNQHMIAVLDACNERGVRCIEVWHSGALKMRVEVEANDEQFDAFFMLSPVAQYTDVKREFTEWLDAIGATVS